MPFRNAFLVVMLAVAAALTGSGCGKAKPDCQGDAVVCGGACAETRSDNLNCGACGNACAPGLVCSAGACATTCRADLVNCGGKCVDPQTDRSFCGASGACTGATAGTACPAGDVCSAGTCALTCQAGLVDCGGKCVDPQTDGSFCGASGACAGATAGAACSTGQVCSAGNCALTCQTGLVDCGGKCVDPQTDRSFCGASGDCTGAAVGTVCASGQVCSAGACGTSCPPGEYACGGKCVDPLIDPSYCGATASCLGGSVCGPLQACHLGTCSALATYSIGGAVTGPVISGVTVTLGGASAAVTTTDALGGFTFGSLLNGSYTVTPSLGGYTFSPVSAAVTVSGAAVSGLSFLGAPLCTWAQAWLAPLSSMPSGGSARGGTLGTGWSFSVVGGRTAFTSTSDWEELTVPSGLAAVDDVFSLQAEFYAAPATLGAGSFRNTGVYAFTDLYGSGQNHGFWAGFREEGGQLTKFEWVVGPATLPATGWDGWDQGLGLAVVAQSATLDVPTGAWHTLRIEGIRSACRFRALLDGALISTWVPAACDLAGGTVAVASARVLPIGIAYSNLAVGIGSAAACVP